MFLKKILKKRFPFLKKNFYLKLQTPKFATFNKNRIFLTWMKIHIKKKIYLQKYYKKLKLKKNKNNNFLKKLLFLKIKQTISFLIKKILKFKKKMLKKFLLKIKIRIFKRKNFRRVIIRFIKIKQKKSKKKYNLFSFKNIKMFNIQRRRIFFNKRFKKYYKKKHIFSKKKKQKLKSKIGNFFFFKKYTHFFKKMHKFKIVKKKLLYIKNKYYKKFFFYYKKNFIKKSKQPKTIRNTKIFSISLKQKKNNLFMQILNFQNLVVHSITLGFFIKHYQTFKNIKKEDDSDFELPQAFIKKAQPTLKRRSITAKIFSIQRFFETITQFTETKQFRATFINISKRYAHVAFRNLLKHINPKAFYWLLKVKYNDFKKKRLKNFEKEKENIFSLTRLRMFHMFFTNTHNGTRRAHSRRI